VLLQCEEWDENVALCMCAEQRSARGKAGKEQTLTVQSHAFLANSLAVKPNSKVGGNDHLLTPCLLLPSRSSTQLTGMRSIVGIDISITG